MCATVSAFGWSIDYDPASQKATEDFAKTLVHYLEKGKDVDALLDSIPECNGKTYKENQVPAKCIRWDGYVAEIQVEAVSKPGFFKSLRRLMSLPLIQMLLLTKRCAPILP